MHKKLDNVVGRLVISNCGTPTEKVSKFLDHYLKLLIKSGKSYVKDTSDFLRKIKEFGNVPDGVTLVTPNVVGLCPSIPHGDGLDALSEELETCQEKKIAKEDLLMMAKFVLKNNFYEFNSKAKLQISGTAIGTKVTPPFACIFMDKVEI